MKKRVLALSIQAMLAPPGESVEYVSDSQETHGTPIKVRFRGAANSGDVLDFSVFLSPGAHKATAKED